MKIVPSLDFTKIDKSKGDNDDASWNSTNLFAQMLQKIYRNLAFVVNGHISLGDGTNSDNIDGVWATVNTPATAGTDLTINHKLGRVPVGYIQAAASSGMTVWNGSVPATATTLTLRFSAGSSAIKLFIFGLLLCFASTCLAQTTNVSIQVTATNSQTWNAGTWSVELKTPPGVSNPGPPFYLIGTTTPVPNQKQNGALSPTGAAGPIVLTQNAGIAPALSQWYFTVCPLAAQYPPGGTLCYTQGYTITALTTSITLAPPAININSTGVTTSYQDTELKADTGYMYYNLTNGLYRYCSVATGSNCTSWASIGGIPSATVATLPPSSAVNTIYLVTDSVAGSCTAGGGTALALCVWTGSVWAPASSAGGGGGTPGGPNHSPQCNVSGSFAACGSNAGVMYVSVTGSDSNNGTSWDTAKLTIYNALCSLPTGNCAAQLSGAGVVYVGASATGTYVHANPTFGAGIWLMGASDPNFASPPVGWLKAPAGGFTGISIIGVPNQTNGPNGHLPRADIIAGLSTDNNHPSIWLSGWNTSTLFQNLYAYAESSQPGRAVVIGECSDHTRTGSCQSTNTTFINDTFAPAQTATGGPCVDIAPASFWFWFEHSGCNGNAFAAAGGITADNAAAWLLDGSYLVTITNSNSAGGGIKVKPGSFGGSVFVKNFTQEGDFSHALPPAVWFTSWGTQIDGVLENINNADFGSGSKCTIQNDGTTGGPTIIGGLIGPCIQGPAYIVNTQTFGSGGNLSNPALNGWVGTMNGYLMGNTDLARRLIAITPNPYTNQLTTPPSTWSVAPGAGGSLSIVSSADPFGGSQAGTVTSTGVNNLVFASSYPTYTGAIGDWLVAGVWVRNYGANTGTVFGACPTAGGITFSKQIGSSGYMSTSNVVDEWEYVWVAGKVATISGTRACFLMHFVNGQSGQFYAPVQYVIPASVASDDEVAEFASTMTDVDSFCQVGASCTKRGHQLQVEDPIDYVTSPSTPANPPQFICRFYYDNASGFMKGLNFTGNSCIPSPSQSIYDSFVRASLNTGGPCPSGSCYTTGLISGNAPTIVGNQAVYSPAGASSADALLNYPTGNGFGQYQFGQALVTGDITQSDYAINLNYASGADYSCMFSNNFTNVTRIYKSGTIKVQGTFPLAVGDVIRCESVPIASSTGSLINLKRCLVQ